MFKWFGKFLCEHEFHKYKSTLRYSCVPTTRNVLYMHDETVCSRCGFVLENIDAFWDGREFDEKAHRVFVLAKNFDDYVKFLVAYDVPRYLTNYVSSANGVRGLENVLVYRIPNWFEHENHTDIQNVLLVRRNITYVDIGELKCSM